MLNRAAQLNGLLVAAIVFTTRADADELTLEVLQPAYRNAIYATQREQPIAIRARMADSSELRGRLLDEGGREVAVASPRRQTNAEVRFDAKPLPVGAYSVEVVAVGPDGKRVAAARTRITKLPPTPGSEVRVDEHRNILIDGRATLPIGWYGAVRLDDPRPEVIKLQNIQTAVVVTYPDKSPVTTMFREHGIRTLVSVEPVRLMYAFELWKQPNHPVPAEHKRLDAPSDECREMLRKLVELLKDEPGLFGWYIADEPEINGFRPQYLEAFYRTLREFDPYHPVVVTNDSLDGLEKFGYRCSDILAPDPYGSKPEYVPNFLEKANSVMTRGQGLMLTPWHAAHHTHFTREYGTEPPFSFRVMRGQYLATLAAGGRGFAGYASDFFLAEPRLRIGLPHLWREVRWLEPALAANGSLEQPNLEPGDKVLAWASRHGEHVTLIVMNAGHDAREFTVRHPALTMVKLPVASEGREVTVANRTFRDTIPAGEASVYSTDPSGLKLPTVAAIEAEIAAFEKASAKPGNVLHASRGVKASASSGTTPWFAQMYYYAINGVTDDEGWHVTHAALPQWVEFSLPRETPIRRVVLHTPNLRDYDLQFRAANGSVLQTEVRGNTSTIAEHVLAEAAPTLKLRVVADATQDGKAMLREIEAYSDAGDAKTQPLVLKPVAAPVDPPPEPVAAQQTRPLWSDDFANFKHKPRHYEGDAAAWVLDPNTLAAQYNKDAKRLDVKVIGEGSAGTFGRLLPYSPEHRFLQINMPRIEGEGYAWATVGFGDSSGKAIARAAVQSMRPGRYTVDTHALHDVFRTGELKTALLNVYLAKGIDYAFADLRLAVQPTDGLAVTMADGSPLPRVLKIGDELLFRLYLEKPATDAVVEIFRDSWYEPVRLNGEPYVQLLNAGRDKDGRHWAAVVRLGEKTDRFKTSGYPVLFRATINGGAIKETMSTLMLDVE